jgi:hypothetical protein
MANATAHKWAFRAGSAPMPLAGMDRSLPASGKRLLPGELRENKVEVTVHAVAEVATDDAHPIQTLLHRVTVTGRQKRNGFDGLFEHSNKGIEVGFVIHTNVITKPVGGPTEEDHQLGESFGCPDILAVAGDGLLRAYLI